jgi:DNA-binding winged helix-turn-helix (wHTH) protein
LLLAFLDAPQRPLAREHLLQATRIHEDIFDRSIDVQVLRLRRKLEIDPSAPRVIRTERGVGYVFALPVDPFQKVIKMRRTNYGCDRFGRGGDDSVADSSQIIQFNAL